MSSSQRDSVAGDIHGRGGIFLDGCKLVLELTVFGGTFWTGLTGLTGLEKP